jgi:hypothetical protein
MTGRHPMSRWGDDVAVQNLNRLYGFDERTALVV